MKRRTSNAVTVLLGALVLGTLAPAACESPVDPDDPAVGTYLLVTVNGVELPISFSSTYELIEARIEVRGDGTCGDRFVFLERGVEEPEEQVTTDTCSWTRTRNTLRFAWQRGAVSTALLEGDRLRAQLDGLDMVFER